ncbi:MAG: hypothetical protein AAF447_21745 [Myxococcota bacterium]
MANRQAVGLPQSCMWLRSAKTGARCTFGQLFIKATLIELSHGLAPPREVLEQAAQLAAWYSKARGAPRVEVHYCKAADVYKERGAPAGQVRIKRFKKLKVTPSKLDA